MVSGWKGSFFDSLCVKTLCMGDLSFELELNLRLNQYLQLSFFLCMTPGMVASMSLGPLKVCGKYLINCMCMKKSSRIDSALGIYPRIGFKVGSSCQFQLSRSEVGSTVADKENSSRPEA